MKKTALTILSYLFCIVVFAQESKPCVFIGLYDKNKSGNCIDREMVHEEINDYDEYIIKRNQFNEAHKTQNPNTRFIDKNENVIAYAYEKEIAGGKCNSIVIGIKTSKSIEDCFRQLADELAKNPKDFTTQPRLIFTWQGKGNRLVTHSEYFGGLTGKFTSGNTATKTIIVAQLGNKTKDKLAGVLLTTDTGAETLEYIYPGNSFTKNFNTKKLDIKVIYLDNDKPEPTIDVIKTIKNFVRKGIINENGKLKTIPISTITGVRG